MEKKYPFSATKHAHDIEFRRARVKNELFRAYANPTLSKETVEKLEALEEQLDTLIGYMHEGIVWLTGSQWALAQECVGWAAGQRA